MRICLLNLRELRGRALVVATIWRRRYRCQLGRKPLVWALLRRRGRSSDPGRNSLSTEVALACKRAWPIRPASSKSCSLHPRGLAVEVPSSICAPSWRAVADDGRAGAALAKAAESARASTSAAQRPLAEVPECFRGRVVGRGS
jgi:hypothetical protein